MMARGPRLVGGGALTSTRPNAANAVIASALDVMIAALPRVTEDLFYRLQDGTGLSLDDTPRVPRGWRGVGLAAVVPRELPTPPEQGV